ncbi:MAG: glycoside hydrolase family 65 protein, partial [Flavobacterium sp.]
MNQDYIVPDNWSIIEEGFEQERVKSSESLFSIGNGAMGQRANFEEHYSGKTFQGSYIGGVYYPDKTKVGWWKNGYPEYFAKVLNAPSWIGINVIINGEMLDLAACKEVKNFRRELNMKEGWYHRSFVAVLQNNTEVEVQSRRFLSLTQNELGVIKYDVKLLNNDGSVTFQSYLDAGVHNEDANWEESFWETLGVDKDGNSAFVTARTFKTGFVATAFMHNTIRIDGAKEALIPIIAEDSKDKISYSYTVEATAGATVSLKKLGGYTVSTNHNQDNLVAAAQKNIAIALDKGFDTLLQEQIDAWAHVWEMADITIEGDVKAQQGIRFNIFQLNQTYTGTDSRLNIGPKGFTGEKYGGSTYWDTEAYCIPFYMATKDQKVARKLLSYRYNHLE